MLKKKKLFMYSWTFDPAGAFLYQGGRQYTLVRANITTKELLNLLPFEKAKIVKEVKVDGVRFVEVNDKFCGRTVFAVADSAKQVLGAGNKLGY